MEDVSALVEEDDTRARQCGVGRQLQLARMECDEEQRQTRGARDSLERHQIAQGADHQLCRGRCLERDRCEAVTRCDDVRANPQAFQGVDDPAAEEDIPAEHQHLDLTLPSLRLQCGIGLLDQIAKGPFWHPEHRLLLHGIVDMVQQL